MRKLIFVLTALPLLAQHASLITVNGRIWTGDPDKPWAEALAVEGDRFVAVGSTTDIRGLASADTKVIDAQGQMVTPGFFDSHTHLLEGGASLTSVQLGDAKSKSDFVARVGAFARRQRPGGWITGGGWDNNNWGGELPSKDWIDAVTPQNPVWLRRVDGHMGLANSKAVELAKVSKDTAEVPGGNIGRVQNRELTGTFKDNAMQLVVRAIPPRSVEMGEAALEAAMRYLASQGVTSAVHMGSWEDLAVFERTHAAGKFITRVYASVPLATWERLEQKVTKEGRGDDWLRTGGLKGYADGSLGSHTAYFFGTYEDDPTGPPGLLVTSNEDRYKWTLGAAKAGLQVMVHAIGDRAIREQLNIYERVEHELNTKDQRFRVEHVQHLSPFDFSRFHDLGVIASVQPYHAIDDGRWAEKLIGPERIRSSYAFRVLLNERTHMAFGSDWPVAPASPIDGIYAAVTRRTLDNKNPDGWIPTMKISVEQALSAYTTEAAYAIFRDEKLGSIKPGKLADFVVLDHDLTKMPPEDLRSAKIVLTVVGGRVVYKRK